MKADLLLLDGHRVLAVADTKYKLLGDSGSLPNPDAYQLITYCLRFGIRTGRLIYADTESAPVSRHVIRGADVALEVERIDLTTALLQIEAQVQGVHDRALDGLAAEVAQSSR